MTSLDEMFKSKSPHTWQGVCTVDPGLGGTGWAYWSELSLPVDAAVPPDDSDVIHPSKGPLEERIADVAHDLMSVTRANNIYRFVVESPMLWPGSPKSQASAERGDLFKLAMVVGAIIGATPSYMDVVLVPAHVWKGQMDKRAVHARIRRALGRKYREHEADAVGIGLAIQGVL